MDRTELERVIAEALNDSGDADQADIYRQHRKHKYHWQCIVCQGDIDAMAGVVAARVRPLLEQERARADAAEDDLAEARALGGA